MSDTTVFATEDLAWPESGLLPVVVQDVGSSEVLMQAWVDREALQTAVETGRGIYFSRSRKQIWVKGETSGNTQKLVAVRVDCDADSLLYLVEQRGAACHTGHRSCYYRSLWRDDSLGTDQPQPSGDAVIERLTQVLEQRRGQSADTSYVARLYAEGDEAVLAKVAEEAEETQQAARQVAAGEQPSERLVQEVADLWFHTMVLLHALGARASDVTVELQRRFGLSGLEEKARRDN